MTSEARVLRLRFETEGEVFLDMADQHADNYFAFMTGSAWYPRPLSTNTPSFEFALRVRSRKPWVPVASGKTVSLREEGESWILETRSEVPAKNIAAFAGKYKTAEKTREGITVRVHAYAMARKNVLDNG